MKKNKIFLICVLIAVCFLAGTVGWVIWGNTTIKTTKYTVRNSRIPESFSGFRIAQVSDLHNAEFGENNKQLLKKLKKAEPDIIVITGDLIDSGETNVQIAVDFCKEAVEIAPVYYVSGNHDVWAQEYLQLCDELMKIQVNVLNDIPERIWVDDDSIFLVGIQDPELRKLLPEETQARYATDKIDQLITDLIPTDRYTVLLSHRPEFFTEYVESGVDLVLTGHAHGGQIRIPFIGGIYAPYQGFFPKYDSGTYTQDKTTMVVSRGLGNGTSIPRINNRPEIVIIELKNT